MRTSFVFFLSLASAFLLPNAQAGSLHSAAGNVEVVHNHAVHGRFLEHDSIEETDWHMTEHEHGEDTAAIHEHGEDTAAIHEHGEDTAAVHDNEDAASSYHEYDSDTAIEEEEEDLEDNEHNGHRRLYLPDACPLDAIPGICNNCNGNGCDAFRCSAFTTWSCPAGYKYCGYESCVGGFCASKVWCVPS